MCEEDLISETKSTLEGEAVLPRLSGGVAALVMLRGPGVGTRYPLDCDELLIGRTSSAGITLNEDSVSRHHAKLERRGGLYLLTDLGSTNGTFVNEIEISSQELRDGDLIAVGDAVFKFVSGESIERRFHEDAYRLTVLDNMTETLNKRSFLGVLAQELKRSHRHGHPLSLLILDVDNFKGVNDTYGHVCGDAVLKELTALVGANLRAEDAVGRYGGEEFAVLLPQTELSAAKTVSEKLRTLVAEHRFVHEGETIALTISVGSCTVGSVLRETEVEAVVAAADAKLYEAKKAGRNSIRCGLFRH